MKDVIFYNDDLEITYRCKVIDFLWDSKWTEVGEFQIQILDDADLILESADPTAEICRYVMVSGKPEIGLIQKWEYASDNSGTVIISGYFAERLLFESVLYGTYKKTANIWRINYDLITSYLDDIGITVNTPSVTPPTEGVVISDTMACEKTGDYIGDYLYEKVNALRYSVGIRKHGNDNSVDISVLNYHDRSGDDPIDDEVVFSVSLNNVKNYDVIKDKSNYRNYAIVAGAGEGDARTRVNVDGRSSSTERRIHLWVDARDVQKEENETQADYESRLRQRGVDRLAEYTEINNIEVEIDPNEADKIGIDYNLGDFVTVVINPYQIAYKMQIIEIEDVFREGKRSASLVFGDPIHSDYNKLRKFYK